MRRLLLPVLASVAANGAHAGGVERVVTNLDVLFEEGRYLELSFGALSPDVSGSEPAGPTFPPLLLDGADSEDMTVGFGTVAIAFKSQVTDELALAVFYDRPYGADVSYAEGTGYYAAGARAELTTEQFTAVLKYAFPNDLSVYGGLRYQTLEASADLPYVTRLTGSPALAGYAVEGERDGAWGWLAGVAYERPEIALRVSLTYASAIDHELDTTESFDVIPDVRSITEVTTPQTVTLDFQTGVAEDTLLFGSVRWAEWTEFVIDPLFYAQLPFDPLVDYADDRWTFSLGLGRQLNENWALAGTVGYEPSTDSIAGNLGPTDGYRSVGLGVTYTQGNVKVTSGLTHFWLGDAETRPGSEFEDNTAVGAGLRIGLTF